MSNEGIERQRSGSVDVRLPLSGRRLSRRPTTPGTGRLVVVFSVTGIRFPIIYPEDLKVDRFRLYVQVHRSWGGLYGVSLQNSLVSTVQTTESKDVVFLILDFRVSVLRIK